MPRRRPRFDLREVDLKEQRPATMDVIVLLRHAVPRPSDLHRLPRRRARLPFQGWEVRVLRRLPRGALREVLLVSLPLRVREVIALVAVDRQAQLALVRSEVVPHEVRIFREVDRLEREASEAFAAVDRRVLLGRDAGAADLAAVLARVHETLRSRAEEEGSEAREGGDRGRKTGGDAPSSRRSLWSPAVRVPGAGANDWGSAGMLRESSASATSRRSYEFQTTPRSSQPVKLTRTSLN
eukprot:31002-Pelagococcus_subviridis.AAC.2